MFWIRSLAVGALVLTAVVGTKPAWSQAVIFSNGPPDGTRAGQVYLTLGGMIGVRNLPEWLSPYVLNGIGATTILGGSFSPTLLLYGPGVTVGYIFNKGVFPHWMGSRTRLGLTGAAWWAQWSSERRLMPDRPFVLPSEAAFPGLFERLHIDHREGELVLRLTSDWRVGPGVTISPSLGVFGGANRTRYKYNAHLINAANQPSQPYRLYQLINGNTVGGLMGLRVNWRLSNRVTFQVGTHVGVYRAYATLFAADCFSTAASATCNSPATAANTLNSTASAIGVRTGMTMVLAFRLRRSFVQIGGFLSYLSAAPSVQNNRLGQFPLSAVPTRLLFQQRWTGGTFLQWRIPFGIR